MPNLSIRDMPQAVHRALKSEAARNRRSLNREILIRLEESLTHEASDAEAVLERIRRRKRAIGPIDLDPQTVRSLREAGRL